MISLTQSNKNSTPKISSFYQTANLAVKSGLFPRDENRERLSKIRSEAGKSGLKKRWSLFRKNRRNKNKEKFAIQIEISENSENSLYKDKYLLLSTKRTLKTKKKGKYFARRARENMPFFEKKPKEKIEKKLPLYIENLISQVIHIKISLGYYYHDTDKIKKMMRDDFRKNEQDTVRRWNRFVNKHFGYEYERMRTPVFKPIPEPTSPTKIQPTEKLPNELAILISDLVKLRQKVGGKIRCTGALKTFLKKTYLAEDKLNRQKMIEKWRKEQRNLTDKLDYKYLKKMEEKRFEKISSQINQRERDKKMTVTDAEVAIIIKINGMDAVALKVFRKYCEFLVTSNLPDLLKGDRNPRMLNDLVDLKMIEKYEEFVEDKVKPDQQKTGIVFEKTDEVFQVESYSTPIKKPLEPRPYIPPTIEHAQLAKQEDIILKKINELPEPERQEIVQRGMQTTKTLHPTLSEKSRWFIGIFEYEIVKYYREKYDKIETELMVENAR